MRRAVCSIVRRGPKVLVVWNKKLSGWSFPGGKLEPGETLFVGNARELREETGLVALKQKLVYQAPSSKDATIQVSVMEVLPAAGEPIEAERGSPVSWLTADELVLVSPYSAFYTRMFQKIAR